MVRPSFRALLAFAETARAGSLAGAARALSVTPSAVSHLLRELEQALGLALFSTRGPHARLSEAGARLGGRLAAAFDAIDAAIAEARDQAGGVRVAALSRYLSLWLGSRLGRFQQLHPATRLLFSASVRTVDLAVEPFECAVRWGRGPWPDLDCTLLSRDRPVVVVNPRLVGQEPLPRLAARIRQDDWALVAGALGWPDAPPV